MEKACVVDANFVTAASMHHKFAELEASYVVPTERLPSIWYIQQCLARARALPRHQADNRISASEKIADASGMSVVPFPTRHSVYFTNAPKPVVELTETVGHVGCSPPMTFDTLAHQS